MGDSGCCYFLHNSYQAVKDIMFPRSYTGDVSIFCSVTLRVWLAASPPCLPHHPWTPLPKQRVCCPNLWGCQVLTFWALSDPGKRYTRLRQHTLATINQNINKNNETSLYIEKLGGKILNVDKSKFMKCLVPYGYVLYWYLLVMCRV